MDARRVRGLVGELVRRVVRRHLHELMACYEGGLKRNPNLQDRVVVQFTITSMGAVTERSVLSSTLNSDRVEGCILSAIARWRFPKPEEGSVLVTYPFTFITAN